ncbi:unnamed protein product [Adineta ricciae]|uniref:Uncharacterized protein n=1 Tax=Adineta ricciae TaxID=249248 RepID=A0A814G2B5_ADIRI|nr:unnamed protein product [Adineta ricciae]
MCNLCQCFAIIVDIFCCRNNDQNVIADGLRNNQTLVIIRLTYNQIANVGIEHLANGLRSNDTLDTLDL